MDDADRPPLFSAWDLLPLAALGATWLWIRHWMPSLPERVPSHWNAAGQVNGWMGKESLFPFAALYGAAFWTLLLLFTLALRAENDQRRELATHACPPLRGLLPLGFILMMGIFVPMAPFLGRKAMFFGMASLMACGVLGLVPLIRMASKAPPISGASDSDYRWGGTIYWNPRDERLWVPKRLGIGWTLNFAKPLAWVVLGLLLILPLALALGVIISASR
jgi:uncharacterized membrane protein